jgi:transposase
MQEEASGFAAFVGIDWADRKHDVCLQVPGAAAVEASVVEHRPKAIEDWAHKLRERFAGQRIAVCLELSHGPIVSALLEHNIFVIYPVNPSTLAKYRRAFTPSRAKDDPTDAAIALEILRCHRDKLKPLRHESPNMRALRRLVEARRDLVQDRVRITNRLTFTLKAYFPQVLDRFRDKETEVFAAFLERWPSLPDVQRARRETIVDFFHAHSVRRASFIDRRVGAIKSERPLTSDPAVIEPARLLVEALLPQLRAVSAGIARLDDEIAHRCQQLPDFFLFADLPGAGRVFSARLLAAFGEQRDRFTNASAFQKYTGIAPVTERSGNKHWVHWRWSCPTFLRQTFVEWVASSVPHSFWARAFYESHRAKGASHNATIRALAFKWIRILFRCWVDRTPYNESRYLAALQKRQSPLLKFVAAQAPS